MGVADGGDGEEVMAWDMLEAGAAATEDDVKDFCRCKVAHVKVPHSDKTIALKDIKAEVGMAKGLGIGALCALCTVNLMLVAAVLALGNVVAEWAAALIVAAAVLAVGTIAGVVGWGKRVKNPLESTRRSLKEDALWAKERLA